MASTFESEFQQLCRQKRLAVTHQRLVLYRALMQMTDHPNPEQIFERVRLELPSISLATVYKTLHVFLEAGMIHEVSPFHGSLRIEPDAAHHHHFICLQCHAIIDLALGDVDEPLLKNSIPEGFQVEQVSTEVRGLCRHCAESKLSAMSA
jgi:Fur family peroxide stress response transcriptional regulator